MIGIFLSLTTMIATCIDGLKSANWDGVQQTETMKSYKEGRTIAPIYTNHKGETFECGTNQRIYPRWECGHYVASYQWYGMINKDYTQIQLDKEFDMRSKLFKEGKEKNKAMVYVDKSRMKGLKEKYFKDNIFLNHYDIPEFEDITIYKHFESKKLCYKMEAKQGYVREIIKDMFGTTSLKYNMPLFYIDIYKGKIMDIAGRVNYPSDLHIGYYDNHKEIVFTDEQVKEFIKRYNQMECGIKWKCTGWEKVAEKSYKEGLNN